MAEKKPDLIKVMTPKGIAKFPALNAPDTKFNPEGEFKIAVILSADATNVDTGKHKDKGLMAMLEEAAQGAYDEAKKKLQEDIKTLKGEKLAKAKKALSELKLGDLPAKPVYDEEGNETGDIALNFKMKATRKDPKTGKTIKMVPKLFDAAGHEIKVFDANKNPIDGAPQIWGGSVVKVAGSLNPFYIPGTNTAGVGIRLAAVQVIELRSGGGGDASSYGFGKEDGYEAPQNAGAAEGFGDESADDAESEGAEEF